MANYQLEQTGAEVQALLNAVESPDTTPAAGSSNLITSGAVQAAVAGVSAEVTALGQEVSEKVDINPGKNLFDKATATPNKFVAPNGTIYDNTSYSYSDYIKVDASTAYYLSKAGDTAVGASGSGICFYDEDYTYLSGIANTKSFTTPVNTAYLRFSLYTSGIDSAQLEKGSSRTEYVPFNPISGYLNIGTDELRDEAVTSDKIGLWAVSKDKSQFFRKNLINPNDADFVDGYYLNNNGGLSSNATYVVTGYIPFNEDMGKMIATINGVRANGGGFYWLYDATKTKLVGYKMDTIESVATWEEGAAYVRFSIPGKTKIMAEVGDKIGPYIPYGADEIRGDVPNQGMLDSVLGMPADSITKASLSTGETLELTDYPFFPKKSQAISFEAQITSFSKIQIGKGYNSYRGKWFEIDSTDIKCYRRPDVNQTPVLVSSFAHNLTIGTFLRVAFRNNDTPGNIIIVLQTLSGLAYHTFESTGDEMNSETFVRSDGSSLTNLILTACGCELDRPVWVFGDSYVSLSADRWPYYMREFGFWDFMLDGLGGISSSSMYSELIRCLKFGRPKYLVWTLGMNDNNNTTYENIFKRVTSVCDNLGITFIGATIPTVPGRDKETISAYVRNSGRRYIDFYKAVGADSSGNWYAGYLSSDDVHPSVLGAKALAAQVLIDFPEIMQY